VVALLRAGAIPLPAAHSLTRPFKARDNSPTQGKSRRPKPPGALRGLVSGP